jgi:hypothetical protein
VHSATSSAARASADAVSTIIKSSAGVAAAAASTAVYDAANAAAFTGSAFLSAELTPGYAEIWASVSIDAGVIGAERIGSNISHKALWHNAIPAWALENWSTLKSSLPSNEDWDVWTRWYEDRLAGRSRGEAYELVFASVPNEVWDQGPAAANRWIKERIEELEKLPQPGPGPRLTVRDERLDIDLHRPSDSPPPSKRSKALLDELREAARDFANGFDPTSNAHGQLRKVVERYRSQIELDDPDVNVIFALGLRLENARLAAQRQVRDGIEPELEDAQQEALASTVQIHAVYIVSEPDGVHLLEAAERYAHKPKDDERFKKLAEQVADRIEQAHEFATERLNEFHKGALEEMNRGEHPARAGTVGRNTTQRVLVFVANAAIGVAPAIVHEIAIHTGLGQAAVAHGVSFANKAVEFLLTNADSLRALAAVAPEGFGFLGPLIDWIRAKLKV